MDIVLINQYEAVIADLRASTDPKQLKAAEVLEARVDELVNF